MEDFLAELMNGLSTPVLLVIIVGTLLVLGRGADLVVCEAVRIATIWRMPKALVGATIVSLGTTLPEVAVSVAGAIEGNADLALGNAVGSIICDTGLILGIAAIISPLPIDRSLMNRQGWIQLGSAALLVVIGLPYSAITGDGAMVGTIPQLAGFALVLLLILYLLFSYRTATGSSPTPEGSGDEGRRGAIEIITKMALGITLVILSSKTLLPAVERVALRLEIPEGIIAATLVAFGTSLPELFTAITAVRRGHGELALGNVVGADILNVLFVVGVSASVGRDGLDVPQGFYFLQLPAMAIILLTFRGMTLARREALARADGAILLVMYLGYTLAGYLGR